MSGGVGGEGPGLLTQALPYPMSGQKAVNRSLTSGRPKPGEKPTPGQEIKDPYVLEFLNLKDEYS